VGGQERSGGQCQLNEAYVIVKDGELFLLNAHIGTLSTTSTHERADPTEPQAADARPGNPPADRQGRTRRLRAGSAGPSLRERADQARRRNLPRASASSKSATPSGIATGSATAASAQAKGHMKGGAGVPALNAHSAIVPSSSTGRLRSPTARRRTHETRTRPGDAGRCRRHRKSGIVPAGRAAEREVQRVLVISVDGLHAVDAERFIASHRSRRWPRSRGMRFATQPPRPRGPRIRFPAAVDGDRRLASLGDVFYDVSWDRTQWRPGRPVAPERGPADHLRRVDRPAEVVNGLAIDQNQIDPSRLPWGMKTAPAS